jgi:hypothetical protein
MPSSWKSPGHKDFEFMEVRGFSALKAPGSFPPSISRAFPPRLPSPKRGRPPKGAKVEPVVVKAVKMPPDFWNALEVAARARGITLHAAMRAALVDWLGRDLGMA